VKIVVTGALGHIGSKLIRDLQTHFENPNIVMVDDLSTQRYSSLFNLPKNGKYYFTEGKVSDVDWDNVLVSANVVIHLAALTDASGTADKPKLVHDNNFESTKVIADACLKLNIPIIFPSSTSVYGSQSDLVDEDCDDLKPQSPYADCKIREENYVKDLFSAGLKGSILRLGTIYGISPGMRFHTAVNKFCWQAVMNQPITVWETAMHQKRPYLAIDDCCNALAWIIKNKIYDGNTFNIVTNNCTVKDILTIISKFVCETDVHFVKHKIMNQLSYEVSADKIKKTGFVFIGDLNKNIKDTIQLLEKSFVIDNV